MGGTLPPLRDRLRDDAKALGEGSQARLTMLYRSTDRRRRCGAPMVNLAHSASRPSCEKCAPSNPGSKHLDREAGPAFCDAPRLFRGRDAQPMVEERVEPA